MTRFGFIVREPARRALDIEDMVGTARKSRCNSIEGLGAIDIDIGIGGAVGLRSMPEREE